LHSETTEHVDQRVDAEEMQATPQQIADARLAYPQQLREVHLLEPSRRRDLLNLDQEVRSDHECSASCPLRFGQRAPDAE
jgi:hypothetical protein